MRVLILTALVSAVSADCWKENSGSGSGSGGQGETWACDGPGQFEITCAASGCDDATIKSNLANDGYPAGDMAACDMDMFMYNAVLDIDQVRMAQEPAFLQIGFDSCTFTYVAPASPTGICDGGAIYVSGYAGIAVDVNGMYTFDADGINSAYVRNNNGIWYSGGSWTLQTSDPDMIPSSQTGKSLKTGDFGAGIMISCDDAYNKLNEEKKKNAQLTEALTNAQKDTEEAKVERQNCKNEVTSCNGDLLNATNDKHNAETDFQKCSTDLDTKTQSCSTLIDPVMCPSTANNVTCPSCPTCPDIPTCPGCPTQDPCPPDQTCPTCDICPDASCADDLSSPIMYGGDYWFCDELRVSDCSDVTHGPAVSSACRKLCGSCSVSDAVCDEKYHTKVVIDGVGSIYCDQIYPEECVEFDNVRSTCCKTCKN